MGFFFAAADGTVPPQATTTPGEIEGLGEPEAWALGLPPLVSRNSPPPTPPRATTMPTVAATIRWRRL